MTISSPVERIATRGRRWTNSHGRFIAAARPISRGVRRLPGVQQHVALGEIEPGAADIGAELGALAHLDPVAVALGVFLDHDRVGAVGQRRAGEDARRLARAERAAEPGAGRDLGDDLAGSRARVSTSAARTA